MIKAGVEQQTKCRTGQKPGRAPGPDFPILLCDHFLLDHNLQIRGHVLVQLHRHGELAQGLQRLVELDLAAIQVDSLFYNGVGNVAGGDRAE